MTGMGLVIVIVLAVVIGWYGWEAMWDWRLFASAPGYLIENIQPQQAAVLLGSPTGPQVLDVRSPAEFAAGALPGAVNLPIADPDFEQRLSGMDRDRPVLVYCAGGFRSRRAIPALKRAGFRSIHHLHRGYLSWSHAGLPVIRPDPSEPVV